MKIGFTLPHMGDVASAENIAIAAKFAEDEGFDSVWVLDRILLAKDPQTPYPAFPDGSWPDVYKTVIDPIETLTYVAGFTQRVQLATGIIDMLYQNPLILAKRLASLDNLSKGRLLLGLGVGHSKDEFDAAGVPFENRGERTDEFLEVLKKTWYDSSVEHKGKYYTIPKSIVGPKPFQKKIPIYFGAISPKAQSRIINSNSNGLIGLPHLDIDSFKNAQDQLRKLAQKNGRDPQSIEFIASVFPEVSDTEIENNRQPANGTIRQISQDIHELEKLGISHVNLSFDFGSVANNLSKRLEYAKQIRDVVIPSVLNSEIRK